MAGIYKTNVPLEDRAWVMEYRADEKLTIDPRSLGVDAIILPMVIMPWDGSHIRVLVEPTFQGRFDELNALDIPIIGKVTIDAGIVTTEQHTEPELDGHTVWQNLVVPKIIDALHIGPWYSADLKPADFRPVKAIIFEMTSEQDHQTPAREIGAFWQTKFFRYVVDHWRVLVNAQAVPNVPLILKSTPDWLQKYPIWEGCADWLYLDISQPKLESTNIFPDLWSIYKNAIWNDFKYAFVPGGYEERVILFEFSAGKQKLSFMTDNNMAYLSKAFDNAAGLAAFLASSTQPPIPPIDDCTELRGRILELESIIAEKDRKLAAWESWYNGGPIS